MKQPPEAQTIPYFTAKVSEIRRHLEEASKGLIGDAHGHLWAAHQILDGLAADSAIELGKWMATVKAKRTK